MPIARRIAQAGLFLVVALAHGARSRGAPRPSLA
jgi:hypothetical protein